MFALEFGNISFPGDHVKELRNAHSHEYKVCLKYTKGYINCFSETKIKLILWPNLLCQAERYLICYLGEFH